MTKGKELKTVMDSYESNQSTLKLKQAISLAWYVLNYVNDKYRKRQVHMLIRYLKFGNKESNIDKTLKAIIYNFMIFTVNTQCASQSSRINSLVINNWLCWRNDYSRFKMFFRFAVFTIYCQNLW